MSRPAGAAPPAGSAVAGGELPAEHAVAGGELPAVLAVDGGSTKTDVALIAADGTPLSEVRGPGLREDAPPAATLRLLGELVDTARRRAGRPAGPVARHTSACLAHLDLPDEETAMARALGRAGWSTTVDVRNDTFAVLRAGLAGDAGATWGVGVVCGTGINGVGRDAHGREARFLAFGGDTGDWGGGNDLSAAASWSAMRAEDGRGPDTALRLTIPAHLGLTSMRAVAVGLRTGRVSRADLAGLTPVLFATAAGGDEVAAALLTRQAEEICVMAGVLMRRLDLLDAATPVVLGGTVLARRHPPMTAAIAAGIAARAPRAVLRVPTVPPVAGAALLGLDHLGAGPDAERRLRAAYGERTAPAVRP
ncbi:N-acetylglucosamine kinase [Micromonospora sp. NPDC018662]|uniref:N-acetylglucosamine kinase n=1 Tax=Micromonospora sp. NPDC018662 TaxID=3364238 RepID=UPI00378C26BC